ncbi:hypothetical protein [Rubellimicrobium roseum]|uniref:Uncharacterized protein n=1 Tax=Rubellimicrobium roseum TaxID=687525 RepID=A0A5C4N9S9_9RHOB|nr:hypothetical protein [Rubellimicrobium roseum]TNC68267.1 hypothetical protein FHG71_14885 [Rubellimicrobium roseum]
MPGGQTMDPDRHLVNEFMEAKAAIVGFIQQTNEKPDQSQAISWRIACGRANFNLTTWPCC